MAGILSLLGLARNIIRKRPKQIPQAGSSSDGISKPAKDTTSQPEKDHQQGIAEQKPLTQHRAAIAAANTPATSPTTLRIALQNQSSSSTVYAYITGLAINYNNAVYLLQADAKTPYFPTSPSSTGQPLAQNVSIPLGAPGSTTYATIPLTAGGRIWFSSGTPLQFFLNPGPGLVEPSIFNPSDPNVNTNFAFCEFTWSTAELFANISYVDFVSALPIALTLTDTSGAVQHVSGMPSNGLDIVCQGLQAQTAKDQRRWSSLIVQHDGQNLRALSPNSGILLNPTWFKTYWTDYVNQGKYTSSDLTINTQASYGNVSGRVGSLGNLNFGNNALFAKPSSKDIFSCSTGPFATGSNQEVNVIIPRLAAAFNRSTLLLSNGATQPNGVPPTHYYTVEPTNHYARIVHAANLDGTGYAFPYDDVVPDNGVPQEGAVVSGSPASFTVTVGGNNAYVV